MSSNNSFESNETIESIDRNKRQTNDTIDSNDEIICGNSYQNSNNSIENKSKLSYGLRKRKTIEPIEPFIYLSQIILPKTANTVKKIGVKSVKKAFNCEKCEKQFISLAKLVIHKDSNTCESIKGLKSIKTVFNCKKCKKQFKSLAQLSKHEKSFASESIKGLKCRECHILFDSETGSVLHNYSVHKKLFKKCFECDFITKSDFELREHSRLHQKLKGKQSEKCEKQQKSCRKQQNFEQKVAKISEISENSEENTNLNENELNAKPNINRKSGINCIECDFQTEDLELMAEHKRCHEWKPFECLVDNCGEYFDESNQLRKHLESKHLEFECEKCGIKFGTFYQKYHHFKDKHFDDMVDCNECNEKFTSEALAEKHRKVHRTHCFKCPECDLKFISDVFLESHLNRDHNNFKQYDCGDCEQKFYAKHQLLVHLSNVHNKRSFECDLCDRKYYAKKALLIHMAKHEPSAEYKCQVVGCDKAYKSELGLSIHNSNTHLNVKWFPCVWPGCERRYKFKSSLKYHTKTHTGVKPFVCDYPDCGKRSISFANLLEHKRIHSSEREFSCDRCDKAFKSKTSLYLHKRGVHEKTLPKRSYVCHWPQCGKQFADPNYFRYHMQSHSGASSRFRCTETGCGKGFFSKSNLKTHMKTHSK